jgi:hypothetical protein
LLMDGAPGLSFTAKRPYNARSLMGL